LPRPPFEQLKPSREKCAGSQGDPWIEDIS
jgi:hypothetical protein